MDSTYLLGVDIGTYGSKGVVCDLHGRVLAYRFMEHGVSTPRPGWCEQDGDLVWWGDFVGISRDLVSTSGVDPRQIAAVGVSGTCPDVLPLGANGHPLYPGMLYSDNRASQEIADITARLGTERIVAAGGRTCSPDSVGAKIVWLHNHEPRVFDQMCMVHTASSYLVYRLTGKHVLDHSTASPRFSPMYDVHAMDWDGGICKELGFSPAILPLLRMGCEIAGEVTADAARATGLAQGTLVTVGAGDALAEAVSTGAVREGEASLLYGSTMVMYAMCNQEDPSLKVVVGPTAVPGIGRMAIGMSSSGALTRWFRDNFGQYEREVESRTGVDAYHLLSDEAAGIPAGSEGLVVLPYFAGERAPIFDPVARGTILGLTLSHTRRHIYRALLEGVAYGLRHGLEGMLESGLRLKRIVATGGGTKSRLWPQIVSDVIGYDQELVASPYGAPLGDAFLAGYGAGLLHDFDALQKEWVRTTDVVRENPEVKRHYDRYFAVYRELYPVLKDDMHALAELSTIRA